MKSYSNGEIPMKSYEIPMKSTMKNGKKKLHPSTWPDIFSRHRQHDAPKATAGGRHGGAQIGLDVQHLKW